MIDGKSVTTYIVIVWLILCAWQDIKWKQINVILICSGFFLIFLSSVLTVDLSIGNRIAGLSLGICLLVLNRLTRNQIGLGDGLVISVIGISLGFSINAFILVYSLTGATLFSITLLVFRKVHRNTTIPFIPFILVSYLGVFLI